MKIKLSEFRELSMEILKKSPIEIVLSLLFLLWGIYVIWIEDTSFGSSMFNLKFYFFACFGITYALNQIFKYGKWRVIYYLSLLSPILFFFYLKNTNFLDLPFFVTMFCAYFLIFVSRGLRDNNKFVGSAIDLTGNLVFAAVLSGISVGAMMTVYAFIIEIFGFKFNDDILISIADLGMYVGLPSLFLMFEYNQKFEIRNSRFCEILFNYILTPTLLAYGAILYIYFAKIVILWELPKGVISVTAILFLAVGLLVKACRMILDKRILNRFFDLFSYIALPALGMLWVAVMYRIMEYGFTLNRLYLLLLTVTLTVWIFAQFFKRTNCYHSLMIFTISLFALFTYAPYINVYAVECRIEKEQKAEKSEYIYLYSKKGTVDFEGYRYFRDPAVEYKDDILTITDNNTGEMLLTISSDELLHSLFTAIGIENYKELNRDELHDLSQKHHIIYRGDEVLIIFESIGLEKRKDILRINNVSSYNIRVVSK